MKSTECALQTNIKRDTHKIYYTVHCIHNTSMYLFTSKEREEKKYPEDFFRKGIYLVQNELSERTNERTNERMMKSALHIMYNG